MSALCGAILVLSGGGPGTACGHRKPGGGAGPFAGGWWPNPEGGQILKVALQAKVGGPRVVVTLDPALRAALQALTEGHLGQRLSSGSAFGGKPAAMMPVSAAAKGTGYKVGGIFAFGQRRAVLVLVLATVTGRPHDLLVTMGGAIGAGLPAAVTAAAGAAVGGAVACPDRKVLALSGDGSAMYTLQSLWTMAREDLDVTVVIFANHVYRILHGELAAVGAVAGRNVARMFDLVEPKLDWVALAHGHAVPAVHCATIDAFNAAFGHAMGQRGPCLIAVEC